MKFSVIIATYNRADELPNTLESLKGLQVNEPWEVIVVDNNSTDNTRNVVEGVKSFPVPLRYIFEREQGRSAALNAGIRAAQGEILAITDDDVRELRDHGLTDGEIIEVAMVAACANFLDVWADVSGILLDGPGDNT